MFTGGGFGVGLTVTDVALPLLPPPGTAEPWLGEVLPVHARTAAEKALELQRVQRLKAELAAYELELVAALAADRPAAADRRPGRPGAAAPGEDTAAAASGVSEFFADELALTLNCARASATTLTEHALRLTGPLRATHTELTQGRLDWPRARTFSEELGWPVRDTDPAVVAAVQAAVLPEAASLSVRQIKQWLRAELAARDAAASDRRRDQAQRAVNVTTRATGTGSASWSPACPTSWPPPAGRRSTHWPGGPSRPGTAGRSACCARAPWPTWCCGRGWCPTRWPPTSRCRCRSAR